MANVKIKSKEGVVVRNINPTFEHKFDVGEVKEIPQEHADKILADHPKKFEKVGSKATPKKKEGRDD